MTIKGANCWTGQRKCDHFRGYQVIEGRITGHFLCAAFPKDAGIPKDIAYGDNKHNQVIEGQTGEFVFKQVEEDV